MVAPRKALVLLAAAVVGVSACGDGTAPAIEARHGVLALRLGQLGDSTGAVLLTLTGGPVDSVKAGCACSLDADLADTTRIFVAGDLGAGDVARVYIPDQEAAANYRMVVEQASNNATYARMDARALQAAVAATP